MASAVFEFEGDIMVLALIAKAYSAGATNPRAPMSHWGAEETNRPITVDGVTYAVKPSRHPETREGGVLITVSTGRHGGDKSQENWFVPYSACRNVLATLKGVVAI